MMLPPPARPWPLPRNTRIDPLVLIGVGGTGGYVAQFLARLLYSLAYSRAAHDLPPTLTLIDGDAVEERNLLRQHFLAADIGANKAERLATRFGSLYALPIFAVPEYLTTPNDVLALVPYRPQPTTPVPTWVPQEEWPSWGPSSVPLIITAVDNHATRRLVAAAFHRMADLIWIDAGNDPAWEPPGAPSEWTQEDREAAARSGYGGQVVVGAKLLGYVHWPAVHQRYPDLLTDTDSRLPSAACGLATVAQPQRLITNVIASQWVASAVSQLLTDRALSWSAVDFHAQLGTVRPDLVTANRPALVFDDPAMWPAAVRRNSGG
jgi:hypothetical protein